MKLPYALVKGAPIKTLFPEFGIIYSFSLLLLWVLFAAVCVGGVMGGIVVATGLTYMQDGNVANATACNKRALRVASFILYKSVCNFSFYKTRNS